MHAVLAWRAHKHIYGNIYLYAYIYIYICIEIYMNGHMYVPTYIHMCVYVCMFVCSQPVILGGAGDGDACGSRVARECLESKDS